MGNVLFHAESSRRRFGGRPEDYLKIHRFLDQSKLYVPDWRHRSLLHSTFGVALCEQMFGDLYSRPSDGKLVCTRTIVEQHILEDLNFLPTPAEFLKEMPLRRWMSGARKSEAEYVRSMTVKESRTWRERLREAWRELIR